MQAITETLIEDVWKGVDQLSEDDAEGLVGLLGEEQPFLLVYLVATGEDEFNEDEKEFLLYMGVVIWKVFQQLKSPLPSISEQNLESIESTNIKMLEYLETESESYFHEFVQNLIYDYPQPALLKFVTELIFDEEEAIRSRNKGMMLVYLKIIIDCLDKVVK